MSNSVAIVTGASQGIGRATAIRLARDFSSLVLIARDQARVQETAQKAKSFGAESLVFPLAFTILSEDAGSRRSRNTRPLRPDRRGREYRRSCAAS
jgi:NAD(P)-dependent dehydrogenase (short-subunit alcohol dehydrogenase family)